VLSSDVPSKHGVNASCIIFDELHAQPNRKLWDVMTDGSMTTRTQPLLLTLTTAGRDPDKTSIGWEVHQRAIDVLAGDREEPYFYPIIYGLGEEKEWADPEMWREEENWGIANPSLGNTFTLKAIRIAYQKAFGIEAKERNFMQLRLNVWLKNKLVGWLKQTTWDLAEIVSKVADLYWKECYGGLDLSSTTDLTAMALFFPNVYGNKKHYAKFWYWMPEDNVTKAEIRDKKPYGEWARKGYITLTPGNVVDYDYIEMRAMDIISKYTMKQMGFDRRFATQPIIHMGQAGIECVEVAQSKKEQTLPINEIEIMVKNEQILHDKNPVTRMCLGNVRLKVDEQENKQFVKVETVGRMDGMAALSNAVDRWKRDNNDEADLSKMISFVGG
jgi:phage terminase large subunit-like protein